MHALAWRAALVVLVALPVPNQGQPPPEAPGEPPRRASPADCPSYAAPLMAFRVAAPAIQEASGLVASGQPGVFWTHNDSGDTARLFAIDRHGLRAECRIPGVTAVDAEDLAILPDPQGPDWLYLADIGDNKQQRPQVAIYRFREPAAPAARPPATLAAGSVERLLIRYEDGPQDVEAVAVDPLTRDLWLFSKGRRGKNTVYHVPRPSFGGRATARKRFDLRLGLVTAADIARDGSAILLRTYTEAFLWTRPAGRSIADALRTRPCRVPLAVEPQGESIAFGLGSDDYFTLSEGTDQPLYRHRRTDRSRTRKVPRSDTETP